jgi:hypothetical protein
MLNERYFPLSSSSDSTTVDGTSRTFSQTLANGQKYLFVSTTNCWLKQGTTPTASAADGSMFWPANTPLIIDGGVGPTLAVIQATAGGTASLTICR